MRGAVSTLLIEYYSKLFTSSNLHDLDRILDGVQQMVTDEMKAELGKPYTSEEVGEAIRQWLHLKLPDRMGCLSCSIRHTGRM